MRIPVFPGVPVGTPFFVQKGTIGKKCPEAPFFAVAFEI